MIKVIVVLCVFIFVCCSCKDVEDNSMVVEEMGRELIEQGRTFVHHAVKRFMIILPAIFFKLGVAFTLLLLVTVVAVNNGFIGFLILVVGLSSVLARLQEARRPQPIPIVYSPPYSHPHHHYFADRSDTGVTQRITTSTTPQHYDQSGDLRYTDVVYKNYGYSNKM